VLELVGLFLYVSVCTNRGLYTIFSKKARGAFLERNSDVSLFLWRTKPENRCKLPDER